MSGNPNIDAYDSEAEVLARLFPAGAPSYIAETRPFLSRLKLPESESGTIVELGCGTGNLMQAVLEVFPAAAVVGVDGAARLVDIARERIGDRPRVSFVISPFEALDWQALPQRCAAVIAVYALEHVRPDDRRRVFRGVHGILRSGGVFLDKEWSRDTRSLSGVRETILRGPHGTHEYVGTPGSETRLRHVRPPALLL